MGTRSVTHIYDGIISDRNHLLSVYKQFDGYINGYGADLSEFLINQSLLGDFNIMSDLCENLLKQLSNKNERHFITTKHDNQEFDYHVYKDNNLIHVKVCHNNITIFDDTASNFSEYVKNYIEPIEDDDNY
jgi:hypothetical protein